MIGQRAVHPQDLSLRDQASLLAAGDLDADDLLDATLARIDERNPTLNAIVDIFPEHSRAMLQTGERGRLWGVPVTIKDMFSLPWRGLRNGSNHVVMPASASGLYRRLAAAGAVVVGVANQHLLGMGSTGDRSAYGPHGNPWNPDRCAGGSSGGSAASVAARMVAGSIGSDSGGSTRLPASYCGVTGLKVTFRRVPYDGYFGAGTMFSAPGLFGRDAADVRLLLEGVLGEDAPSTSTPPASASRDATVRDPARLLVGIIRDPFWADLDPDVDASCAGALTAAGWELRDVALPATDLLVTVMSMLLMSSSPGPPPPAVLADLDPPTRAAMLLGGLMPAYAIARADRVRSLLRRSVAALFADADAGGAGIDVLAWPTTPASAPSLVDPMIQLPRRGRIHADAGNIAQAVLANITGIPGISVPVGFTSDGMPIGLQLLGPWQNEWRLLDAAEHLEAATGRRFVDAVAPTSVAIR